MKALPNRLIIPLFLSCVLKATAAVFYVDVNSTNPVSPYASLANAAPDIQTAIDDASAGDQILVAPGAYQTGGRVVYGSITNRVAINKAVVVQSLNGPAQTFILGIPNNGTALPTNGNNAVRCVYLTNNAALSGFTLAFGSTRTAGNSIDVNGGGAWCEGANALLSNCVIRTNSASFNGGGLYSGELTGGLLAGNSAGVDGGGADNSWLIGCTVSNNIGVNCSGVFEGISDDCLIAANGLTNLTSGSAAEGGTFYNCTITANYGGLGAAQGCRLANSIIYGNHSSPGDCYQCLLTNCCTSSLTATGPGVNTFTNPPAFIDPAFGNYHLQIGSPCIDTGTNAFTPPGPDLDGNPRTVGAAVDVGAYENQYTGLVHYVSLTNLNPLFPYTNWTTAATNLQDAIGSAQPGEVVAAGAGIYTNGGIGMLYAETNRVVLTNGATLVGIYGSQSTFIAGGHYTRCVYLGNNSVLQGFTITNGDASYDESPVNDQSGGGIWSEPGGVVSDCLIVSNYAGYFGGGVSGGTVYNSILTRNTANWGGGGANSNTLVNCVLSNNFVLGQDTLGALGGGGAAYCNLSNCLLVANNCSEGNGGGASFCVLTGCVVSNNTANWGGGVATGSATASLISSNFASSYGGGALSNTLNQCTLRNNFGGYGGGVYAGTLNNCGLFHNVSANGGAAYYGTLNGCALSGNSTTAGTAAAGTMTTFNGCTITNNTNNAYLLDTCTLNDCVIAGNKCLTAFLQCTAINSTVVTNNGLLAFAGTFRNCILYYNSDTNPLVNIFNCCVSAPVATYPNVWFTNAPLLANLAGGDYHLQSNSPCINSGNNSYATNATDLDGNPRIVGGTVDLGAYEYQTPASIISYQWLESYGLPTDGSADFADPDGDGANDWQEWQAGTSPANALSVLAMSAPTNSASGVTLTWQSVSNRTYYLQRSADLTAQPPFSTIQSNITGLAGITTTLDATATNANGYFYRVGVQ